MWEKRTNRDIIEHSALAYHPATTSCHIHSLSPKIPLSSLHVNVGQIVQKVLWVSMFFNATLSRGHFLLALMLYTIDCTYVIPLLQAPLCSTIMSPVLDCKCTVWAQRFESSLRHFLTVASYSVSLIQSVSLLYMHIFNLCTVMWKRKHTLLHL